MAIFGAVVLYIVMLATTALLPFLALSERSLILRYEPSRHIGELSVSGGNYGLLYILYCLALLSFVAFAVYRYKGEQQRLSGQRNSLEALELLISGKRDPGEVLEVLRLFMAMSQENADGIYREFMASRSYVAAQKRED